MFVGNLQTQLVWLLMTGFFKSHAKILNEARSPLELKIVTFLENSVPLKALKITLSYVNLYEVPDLHN